MISYKEHFNYLFEGQNENNSERLLIKAGLITNKNDQLYKDLNELDKTQTKKHLPQLVLYYIETEDLSRIKIVYDDFIESRLKDTDIRKYKTLQEFENEVHRVKPAEADLGMKNIKVSGTPVYKDSKIEVFKGNSQKACVQYGDGYSFCISDKIISRNLFYSYRFRDKLKFTVYFIRFLGKDSSKVDGKFVDPLHLIVLHIGTNNSILWTGADNGNQGNNTVSITKEELLEKFPELSSIYDKVLVFDEYTEEEEAILKHVYNKDVTDEAFKNFPDNVKSAYISTGKQLTDKMWDVCNEEMRIYYINVGAGYDLSEHQKRTASRDVLKNYNRILVIRVDQKLKNWAVGTFIVPFTNDELLMAYKNDNTRNDLIKRNLKIVEDNVTFQNERNDVDGDVELEYNGLFYKFPIKFGKVTGDFECNGNNLTTLEGGPDYVGGNFGCHYNNLTTLKGGPDYVGANFNCIASNLTSLEGAPKSVGGNFVCNQNNLTSLEGAPRNIKDSFFCDNNNLTSLEGGPDYVGGNFGCHDQKNGHKFTEAQVRAVCNVKGKVIV